MKIYFRKQELIFSSELVLLSGFVDQPQEGSINYNSKGEGRFDEAIKICRENIIYVDNPLECDIIVFPQKFHSSHPLLLQYMNLSQQYNKQLWCFYNDDNDKSFKLPNNVVLWRTSFYLSTKFSNEKAIPAFSTDFFSNILQNPELSIGYCGHVIHGRKKYIANLLKSDINTDFILRKGFWAPGIDKIQARKEYLENMNKNLFVFCYRGAGNFSYRFYETSYCYETKKSITRTI